MKPTKGIWKSAEMRFFIRVFTLALMLCACVASGALLSILRREGMPFFYASF